MGRPNKSAAATPNNRSAAGFKVLTRNPAASFTTTGIGKASNTADRNR